MKRKRKGGRERLMTSKSAQGAAVAKTAAVATSNTAATALKWSRKR